MTTAAPPILPPITRESHEQLVRYAVAAERLRCLRVVRCGALDAFGGLDWDYLRERIATEIEKGAA